MNLKEAFRYQNKLQRLMSGSPMVVSHLETVLLLMPIYSASSAWVRPRFSYNCLMVLPVT